jgi:hypothetical protein
MLIYVCKHGVDAGIIIENGVDYENEEVMAKASQMVCQKCADEMLAELVGKFASITETPGATK